MPAASTLARGCILALLCVRSGAVRDEVELDGEATSALVANSTATLVDSPPWKPESPPADKNNFIFVEIYQLKGANWKGMKRAVQGKDIADEEQKEEEESLAEGVTSASTTLIYHTEVTICPRDQFSDQKQRELEKMINEVYKYQKVKEDWWRSSGDAHCEALSYGSGGVEHYNQTFSKAMSGINNADLEKVWKYVYGTSDLSAKEGLDAVTFDMCSDYWSGDNYHPIKRNCNFFTSTILKCGFELSQMLPPIGPSSTRKVWTCEC